MVLSGVPLCCLRMSCLCPFRATLHDPLLCPVFSLSMPPSMSALYVSYMPIRDALYATCVRVPLGHCYTLSALAPHFHAPLQAYILSPCTPPCSQCPLPGLPCAPCSARCPSDAGGAGAGTGGTQPGRGGAGALSGRPQPCREGNSTAEGLHPPDQGLPGR